MLKQLGPEVMKARQKSKAMAWEMKMKSRRAVKPPVVIGCLFDHSQGHPVPEGQSFLALFQVCLHYMVDLVFIKTSFFSVFFYIHQPQ